MQRSVDDDIILSTPWVTSTTSSTKSKQQRSISPHKPLRLQHLLFYASARRDAFDSWGSQPLSRLGQMAFQGLGIQVSCNVITPCVIWVTWSQSWRNKIMLVSKPFVSIVWCNQARHFSPEPRLSLSINALFVFFHTSWIHFCSSNNLQATTVLCTLLICVQPVLSISPRDVFVDNDIIT